jgi:ferritin-like metal-binding protein YciE
MTPQERYDLSRTQTLAYLANSPGKEEALHNLEKTLNIKGAVYAV